MNVVLIGYRGTGKTSVARVLAGKLGVSLVSTDELIALEEGMGISEIVEKKGWEFFREIEREVISKISKDNCVIDCGGGVVENPENITRLKKNSKIILLTADPEVIVKRIENDRPALTNKPLKGEVHEMLKRRMPLYQNAADFEVDTTNLSIVDVAGRITELIK